MALGVPRRHAVFVPAAPAVGARPASSASRPAALVRRCRPRWRVGIHPDRRSGRRILAQAGSPLIEAYHAAAPTDQPAILIDFHLLRDAFVFGVWQTLDGLTAGIWVLSVGWLPSSIALRWGGYSSCWGVAVGPRAHDDVGIHSLAVLGGGLAMGLAVWIGWVALERRQLRPSSLLGHRAWSGQRASHRLSVRSDLACPEAAARRGDSSWDGQPRHQLRGRRSAGEGADAAMSRRPCRAGPLVGSAGNRDASRDRTPMTAGHAGAQDPNVPPQRAVRNGSPDPGQRSR